MPEKILVSCDLASAKKFEFAFSNLKSAGYCIESPKTKTHNCIAYAAGKRDKWWWPDINSYWPISQREETTECFILAYETVGYEVCDSGDFESDFEKIAIYVDLAGIPTHAAIQLPSGEWKSKCGGWEDISHATPEAVGGHRQHCYGEEYGVVEQYMRRPRCEVSDT